MFAQLLRYTVVLHEDFNQSLARAFCDENKRKSRLRFSFSVLSARFIWPAGSAAVSSLSCLPGLQLSARSPWSAGSAAVSSISLICWFYSSLSLVCRVCSCQLDLSGLGRSAAVSSLSLVCRVCSCQLALPGLLDLQLSARSL